MLRLTEEQKGNITKNAEMFLQVYEEAKRAAISYGLPREEWQLFTMVFTLADLINNFANNSMMRYMDTRIKELEMMIKEITEKEK